jgi:hypothetical protein
MAYAISVPLSPFQTSEVVVNEAKMKTEGKASKWPTFCFMMTAGFGLVFLASAAVIHQKWQLPQKNGEARFEVVLPLYSEALARTSLWALLRF